MTRRHLPIFALVALSVLGCKKSRDPEEMGSAPPPVASAKPGVCTSGGGVPGDAVSEPFFPRLVSGYCVDPHGDTRAYGENAKGTLDDVCTQQLDGECEVYKSHGLRRVVTLRYVDDKGSPGSVAVTLSRFATKEGAYAFFSKRVVADADPIQITLSQLPAGASAALGSGIAYVFRGEYLAELSYTNEAESPDQMRESGKRVLPSLASELGERLPGDKTLPPAVVALPAEHLLPMGSTYALSDLLGISSLGGGAVGFYKDGEKRYRVLSLARADEASASDIIETLKKLDRASTLKELLFPAIAFATQHDDTSPKTEWVLGRKGSRVFAVGDEELVLGGGHSKDEEARVKLTRDEKIAILKRLVGGA